MAFRDGDGWVACECGTTHWGRYGAAGLLLVRRDRNAPEVLLQLRAAWTHGGGTWALPGGARDSHEDSIVAAVREASEEAGIDELRISVRDVFRVDHGNWLYDTVIATSEDDADAHAANAESEDLRWVPLDEVERFPLHVGLASAWPELRPRVVAAIAAGDD